MKKNQTPRTNKPLVYKFGDPMCPKCGCNPNCVCHVEGEGGCVECPNECLPKFSPNKEESWTKEFHDFWENFWDNRINHQFPNLKISVENLIRKLLTDVRKDTISEVVDWIEKDSGGIYEFDGLIMRLKEKYQL